MLTAEGNPRFETKDEIIYELERQAAMYKGLGIKKDAVMRLASPRPAGLPEDLAIPVVSLGSYIDIPRQAHFAQVDLASPEFTRGKNSVWAVTFPTPHLIWMQIGVWHGDLDYFRFNLRTKERPATLADGLALTIVTPDIRSILSHYAIVLPGTILKDGAAPTLMGWGGNSMWIGRTMPFSVLPNNHVATCGG
jgi:hypothetical protein